MATPAPAIDLSDLGGKQVTPPTATATPAQQTAQQKPAIDLSDLGGQLKSPTVGDVVKSTDQTPTQFSYPAAGPGAPIITTTMPKAQAEQQEEEGRQARSDAGKQGLIFAGSEGALSLLGPALDFLGIGAKTAAEKVPQVVKQGTGILDEYGNEIFRDVPVEAKHAAWKILQTPNVQKAIKESVRLAVTTTLGKAGEKLAGEGGAIAGGTLGASLGGRLGDKLLGWLLEK